MRNIVGIIDYNIGNIGSISNAFRSIGAKVIVSDQGEDLLNADMIVLPGVGSFKAGIKSLKEKKLDSFIKEIAKTEKKILGICLGMQIFGKSSQEDGYFKGLDLFPYEVVSLFEKKTHIGWNYVSSNNSNQLYEEKLNTDFYFNHSFGYLVNDFSFGISSFNSIQFASFIKYKNIYGFQFHPEKSQKAGMQLLKIALKN